MERIKARINAMNRKFMRKMRNKTKRDRICNEIIRKQLMVELSRTTAMVGTCEWDVR